MNICPTCEGRGETFLRVTSYCTDDGKPKDESCNVKCVTCKGDGELTDEELVKHQKFQAFQKNFWCKCKGHVTTTYHPDAPGSKHHYTCDHCGKVTQIG